MLSLGRTLLNTLERQHVRIDVRDGNTVVLRNLPLNPGAFNKAATNVLLERPAEGKPFLVCVDHDLQYTGTDPDLSSRFSADQHRRGWRALALAREPDQQVDLESAVRLVLGTLGTHGIDPDVGTTALSEVAPVIGLEDRALEVIACLSRSSEARLALITGPSGAGKSALLRAVADGLGRARKPAKLATIHLASWLARIAPEPPNTAFAELLRGLARDPGTITAIECLDLALSHIPQADLLLTQCLDDGGRLIGTILPPSLPWFGRDPLARRTMLVHMEEPGGDELLAILRKRAEIIAAHHQIRIDPSCINSCLAFCRSLPGALPGKALILIDSAASRAALAGAAVVTSDDLCAAASTMIFPEQAPE